MISPYTTFVTKFINVFLSAYK